MPLTPEQMARMEQNRKMALLKKRQKETSINTCDSNSPVSTNLSSKPISLVSKSVEQKSTVKAKSEPVKPAIRLSKPLICKFVLVSNVKFEARVGYHEALIEIFKSMTSSEYKVKDRMWTFHVDEHDLLLEKIKATFKNQVNGQT